MVHARLAFRLLPLLLALLPGVAVGQENTSLDTLVIYQGETIEIDPRHSVIYTVCDDWDIVGVEWGRVYETVRFSGKKQGTTLCGMRPPKHSGRPIHLIRVRVVRRASSPG